MIFTYFGIVLFLTWEWDKFIKERPVKQAIRPNQAGTYGIPYACVRSRHPEQLLPMVQLDNADNNVESQETLSGTSGPKAVQSCGKLLKNPQNCKNPI